MDRCQRDNLVISSRVHWSWAILFIYANFLEDRVFILLRVISSLRVILEVQDLNFKSLVVYNQRTESADSKALNPILK